MTIQDSIRDMFSDLATNVPRDTAVRYLKKSYPNMSIEAVNMALNRSIFDMQCNFDKDTDMLSMYKGPALSSARLNAMNKAFRVAIELMDDTQKITSNSQMMRRGYPFEYLVITGNKVYEIAFIANGQETASSILIGERYVEPEERQYVRRIAVVDYGCDIEYIKRVGFSKIARVTAENEVEVIESIDQEEAWEDMDED